MAGSTAAKQEGQASHNFTAPLDGTRRGACARPESSAAGTERGVQVSSAAGQARPDPLGRGGRRRSGGGRPRAADHKQPSGIYLCHKCCIQTASISTACRAPYRQRADGPYMADGATYRLQTRHCWPYTR